MSRKVEVEPNEKPSEVKECSSCGVTDCDNNLFGYCQIIPNIDKEGKCISRRNR